MQAGEGVAGKLILIPRLGKPPGEEGGKEGGREGGGGRERGEEGRGGREGGSSGVEAGDVKRPQVYRVVLT